MRILLLMFIIVFFLPMVIGFIARLYVKKHFNNIPNQSGPINKEISQMVKCAKCQLYIPENEAVTAQGNTYCCHAHAQTHTTAK